ncbi:hypothetical protein [Sutcliffiella horikoshii]|uniref:hypothetical protein n=1 Tax=Sutcliffiella horikoshii TaxID=79883 RepID=UPI0021CC76AC|nr:hypothetical protein [Sutcliffiella horikoshii]
MHARPVNSREALSIIRLTSGDTSKAAPTESGTTTVLAKMKKSHCMEENIVNDEINLFIEVPFLVAFVVQRAHKYVDSHGP